jgi:hypothetical protein
MRKLAIVAAALALSGCATFGPMGEKPRPPAFPEAARAEDIAAADAALGSRKVSLHRWVDPLPPLTPDNGGVVVELDQQRAYLFHENTLVAVTRISSGRRNHRTETGVFTVGSKRRDHRSNVYGDFVGPDGAVMVADVDARVDAAPPGAVYRGASMANFLRLHHQQKSTPIGFHAGKLPGYPASHGCLRLPRAGSEMFFDYLPVGFPIIVRGEKYGVPFGTRQAGTKRPPKSVPIPATEGAPSPTGDGASPAVPESATPSDPSAAPVVPVSEPAGMIQGG